MASPSWPSGLGSPIPRSTIGTLQLASASANVFGGAFELSVTWIPE